MTHSQPNRTGSTSDETADETAPAGAVDTPAAPYHHGNLRDALLDAVGQTLTEKGITGLSLREAARRAGVSHGAPAHHFGDKLGMLTAFSARGFERFGSRLRAAADGARSPSEKFVTVGVEYVRFAVEERAYFEVMFREDLHDAADPHFEATSQAAFSVLMDLATELA